MMNLETNNLPLNHQIMDAQHLAIEEIDIKHCLPAIWTVVMVCQTSVYVRNTIYICFMWMSVVVWWWVMVEGPRPYSGYGGYGCVGVASSYGGYGGCPYTGGAGSYSGDIYNGGARSYGQGYSGYSAAYSWAAGSYGRVVYAVADGGSYSRDGGSYAWFTGRYSGHDGG